MLLETSASTNSKRTLIEIELAPGGGNVPYYHTAFSERFEVLEGELQVRVGNETYTLRPEQSKTAYPNTLHCVNNPSDTPTRYLVDIQPGSTGFEQALKIGYGLATDDKTNERGVPKNIYHLAVTLIMGESRLSGMFALLLPVFHLLAAWARKQGIEQELIDTYC